MGISEPKGLAGFIEPVIVFIEEDVAIPNIGEKKYARFMPYLLTVFFFILLNNLMGLIPFFPFGANVTGNIAVTMVLAILTFLITQFSSNRMVREYVERLYLPAARAFSRRADHDGRLGREIEAWKRRLDESWNGIHFGAVRAARVDAGWRVEAQVYLGDLDPADAAVQLFAEPEPGSGEPECEPMSMAPIAGAVNGFLCSATVPGDRPVSHYTPRVVPHHPDAFVPLEAAHITWCPTPAVIETGAGQRENVRL